MITSFLTRSPVSRPISVVLLIMIGLVACRSEELAVDVDSPENPPVIVISIDTLRSDHLPAYGYDAIATPAIDQLRRDAVLFRRAYAQAPTTLPSHSSMFTGLLPPRHGVRNNLGYELGPSIPTIASTLSSRGYETGAAVSAYVLRSETGIASGFDFYDEVRVGSSSTNPADLMRNAQKTNLAAKEWIGSHDESPFFFFLHYFEPHHPYENGGYDGEIEAADSALGQFLDFLREHDLYEKSLIIVLSDHGEGLGDHGEPYHGVFVYRESIQVPLIVKMPGNRNAGTEITGARSLVDVMPTILEIVGVEPETELDGRSLFRADDEPSPVYSESLLPRIHFGWSELRSVITGDVHVIEAPRPEVYLLGDDPRELNNVIDDRRRDYAAARVVLDGIGAGIDTTAAADQEQRDRLAALGYIGSAGETTGPAPDPKDHIGELELLLRGSELQSKGDCSGALAAYKKVLEQNPRLTDAWARSAQCLEATGQPGEAIAAYRRAIDLSPQLVADYALPLAHLFLRAGQPAEAARHAELAAGENPGPVHLLLGRIALAQGDLVEAQREAGQAEVHEEVGADAAVLRARIAIARGEMDHALAILGQIEPPAGAPVRDYHLVRGDALARLDRFDQARASFEREIVEFPANLPAYTSLAIMEVVRGRPEEAIRVLDRMVDANPGESARQAAAETMRTVGAPDDADRWR